ncbi:MAG TPA: iron uptake transporter permease EfeU [Demequinaceae bacterium]
MFANFLIGLREGLEAALVVGILVAYLIRSDRRELLPHVWIGVAIATTASLGAGAALTFGPRGLSARAEEAIAGTLSVLAVGLITWMIFWMARTARDLRRHLETSLDAAVSMGKGAIVAMALLAVGREGLETAVFLWAGIDTAGAGAGPIAGAVLGLACALALGRIIYRGALRVDLRAFFRWTGLVLIAVAAGVLAHAVHDLQDAGVLPGAHALAFDVSAQIPPDSWHGSLLGGAFNFSPATTWLEALTWAAYAIPTLVGFARISFARRPTSAPEALRAAGSQGVRAEFAATTSNA